MGSNVDLIINQKVKDNDSNALQQMVIIQLPECPSPPGFNVHDEVDTYDQSR